MSLLGCSPFDKLSTTWSKTLTDLLALDNVNSLYESLPTSCFGTLLLSLSMSSFDGIPSNKVKAASHLVAITLSDLSSSLISLAKQMREYVLLSFVNE